MYDKIEEIELMLNMTSTKRHIITKYYQLSDKDKELFQNIYFEMNVRMKLGLFSYKIEGNINQEIYKLLESLGYNIDIVRTNYIR